MTDTEMLAMQARKIMELEVVVAQMKVQLKWIKMTLVRVGGPLNDNLLHYNKEQLKPFFRIQDILDGCID
jgi:hypothetical protein